MGKLKVYSVLTPPEQVIHEREAAYLALSSKEKFLQLLALIRLSTALNGGHPLKQPQGKGLVISRNNIS
jgi:hypothetical protein